jgi:hypothetical protein
MGPPPSNAFSLIWHYQTIKLPRDRCRSRGFVLHCAFGAKTQIIWRAIARLGCGCSANASAPPSSRPNQHHPAKSWTETTCLSGFRLSGSSRSVARRSGYSLRLDRHSYGPPRLRVCSSHRSKFAYGAQPHWTPTPSRLPYVPRMAAAPRMNNIMAIIT